MIPTTVALLALLAAPALAEETPGASVSAPERADGAAFVAAFKNACVPQRLSFPGTKSNAESLGWTVAENTDHPELAVLIEKMLAATVDPEMEITLDYEIYTQPVAERQPYLIVSRSQIEMEAEPPLDKWTSIGCYLYDFDASAMIDPAPVTALIEKPVANAVSVEGMEGYVWGPGCDFPRTMDTYLTFVADGGPYAEQIGFSGLLLKFETSEPDPGETVPETYC